MVESTPLEDIDTGRQRSHCRYFKLKILPLYKAKDTDQIVTACVSPESAIRTDESTSYVNLSKIVDVHTTKNQPRKQQTPH